MANHLKMAERETIAALHRQGWSIRRMARELSVDRGTVRRLLRARLQANGTAAESSKTPTLPEVLTGSLAAKAPTPGQVLTGSESEAASGGCRSKCDPFRSVIE